MNRIPSPSFIQLAHGRLDFPSFLPDATYGFVRSIDAGDIEACGVQAVMMNSFHLMQRPGSSTIQALGGLHRMSGWQYPIFCDSGGFQAYSLIRQNGKFGKIHAKGLTFTPEGSQRKYQLTPEKSVQLQVGYGADVVICLDDCTHVESSFADQRLAVQHTIDWARRGKETYSRLGNQKGWDELHRPRLFAVIQGGGVQSLRKECAEELLAIGFDGFGYGGWPLDDKGNLLEDILGYTRQLVPQEIPMHALGVGHPLNVLKCANMGYEIFDSAMPTRDARHGRLYVYTQDLAKSRPAVSGDWMDFLYINDERHIRSDQPLSPFCDCAVCKKFPTGYLRHLFRLNDSLFLRLATIHNLRFMTQLTGYLRESKNACG